NEAIEKASEILAKYVALETDGIDAAAVNAEITELKAQITAIATSADFEGQNLLSTTGTAVSVVSGYVKGTGATMMTIAKYDLQAAPAAITTIATAQSTLDAMKAAAATMGATKMRFESQTKFVSLQM